ncbi:MAG: PHP domain-containing protein [Sedimenticola sp.]|nr:PHP domain-containing protein [Sedimenticola sp.]MCW8920204.1 PHP domain-containing protein [Sedimenticola sp.]MCW8949885.1 PHP domain-containing protein [Sedimenticola sp.]MDF1528570.1 PHP domain-containing protein [Sedimenticola sp.]
MTVLYDLHTHSTASDGTLTPTALVACAAEAGVDVLALTDHDTTEGLAEAASAAQEKGIRFITGVEISVTWGGQVVHIVGLGFDPADSTLQAGLARLREFRNWRAEEIGIRLAKHQITGAYEGAKALSNGRLISRSHFARFLVANGYAPDMRKVFKQFLTQGKPGHVAGEWADLAQAVSWIKEAGGQSVIAHPARYSMTRTKLRRLIGEFQEAGGDALEVVSSSHSKDEVFTMARHAKDFSLMGSAGSDYHGPETPWANLGRLSALPDLVIPIWRNWSVETEAEPV